MKITRWDKVIRDSWSYSREEQNCEYIIYKLTALPDFSGHRFAYLSKEPDARKNEIIKRQMGMLRRFHTLRSNCGISLRFLKKDSTTIQLYLVFRQGKTSNETDADRQNLENSIDSMLMNMEYSFQRVTSDEEYQKPLPVRS